MKIVNTILRYRVRATPRFPDHNLVHSLVDNPTHSLVDNPTHSLVDSHPVRNHNPVRNPSHKSIFRSLDNKKHNRRTFQDAKQFFQYNHDDEHHLRRNFLSSFLIFVDSIRDYVSKFFRNSRFLIKKCLDLGLQRHTINDAIKQFKDLAEKGKIENLQLQDLRKRDETDVRRVLTSSFIKYLSGIAPNSNGLDLESLIATCDMQKIYDEYISSRTEPRKVILHIGPTNSGKTYSALKALESCKKGIYCGPLRLLAHEIYEKLNSKDIPCNLVTGEDRRETEDVHKYACTIEMALTSEKFDVAVIDEIQMISDPERGWAWTNALLGLQAAELHVCGEMRSLELVKRMCEAVGDEIEVREYKRLTELEVQNSSLFGKVSGVRKGDCVITFSRRNIFALKKVIEKRTGLKCAVVYGALPPETRSEQARLFNDQENEYDVLVASDAVGMGLNLNIKRIVFDAIEKYNGVETVQISYSQIKQIAGRAGRFKSAHPKGYVTAFDEFSLPVIRTALQSEAEQIKLAGMSPSFAQVEKLSAELPGEPLSVLLDKFHNLANTGGDFFLCEIGDKKRIADIIEPIENLSLHDRYQFSLAPARLGKKTFQGFIPELMFNFAEHVANERVCHIDQYIDLSVEPNDSNELIQLELKHSAIMVYRFPDVFSEVGSAHVLKYECEAMINDALLVIASRRTG